MSSGIKKFFVISALCLVGCTRPEEAEREKVRQMNAQAEMIYRSHEEQEFVIAPPKHCPRAPYPWE